jgi:hypothetical protein
MCASVRTVELEHDVGTGLLDLRLEVISGEGDDSAIGVVLVIHGGGLRGRSVLLLFCDIPDRPTSR